MLELQEATAKAAPNYYTKEYEESSIWKKLGTSIFWADLIKNLGFTEGMLIPGMGVSAALSKTPMAMQLIGSSVAGALSEASIEAIQAKQDKLNLESTQIANEYNKAIDNFVTKIKKYMETTEQATYIEEINNGNDNYSAMTIYDYVDELANELKAGEQNE